MLRRCTERNARVVDFYLYLAADLVTIVTGPHYLRIGRQRFMTMDRQPSLVIVCVGRPPRSGWSGTFSSGEGSPAAGEWKRTAGL